MHPNLTSLWNAWRTDCAVREMAEEWVTTPRPDWTDGDDRFYQLLHESPDRALSVIFAMMQITDDEWIHANIAAGPLEDFLGSHGEAYIDGFHKLAHQERRLRELLDGVWQGRMSIAVWRRIEILKQSAFS